MNETAPSRSRSALDAVYSALPTDRMIGLADVVKATGLDREVVRVTLSAAKAGHVADGLNGKWSRSIVQRTAFRDQAVLGFITEHGPEVTFEQALVLPVSRPQLYTSLARLQVAGKVQAVRDGSRTPKYSAVSVG